MSNKNKLDAEIENEIEILEATESVETEASVFLSEQEEPEGFFAGPF